MRTILQQIRPEASSNNTSMPEVAARVQVAQMPAQPGILLAAAPKQSQVHSAYLQSHSPSTPLIQRSACP
eukprot:3855335-Amphidinium_carterae.1